MVELGDKVKDPVTGIMGIAYCRTVYLQGCDRIGIQGPTVRVVGQEPKVPDLFHVDEPQLTVMKKQIVKKAKKTKLPGGPSSFSKNIQKRR